jgi:hypothetical protein
MNRRERFAAGATAAVLVVGVSGGTAWAAGSTTTAPGANARGGGFSVSGTLVSVGKSSLAFKLSDGTVATATLSSSTVYTKTATVKASALKKGQTVTVTGTESAGTIPATRITVGGGGFGGFGGAGGRRPGGAEGAGGSTTPRSFPEGAAGHFGEGFGGGGFTPPTFGTISAVSGGNFTLTEANKTTVKVTTSSSTTISETSKITKSGLTVGQTLSIRGTEKSNTVVAASSVSEGNLGFAGFGGRPGGGGAAGGAPGGTPPAG